MQFRDLRILVIENDPGSFLLIETQLDVTRLHAGFFTHAFTLTEGIAYLSEHPVDLVLLNPNLPDTSPAHAFDQLRSSWPDMPIVILTGIKDEDIAQTLVNNGAQDYLVKEEMEPRILEKTILYAIERQRNLNNLQQSQQQYEFLFEHNPLPMWAYDIATLRFTMVNNAAVANYGYSKEEFLAMTILDIRPEEERSRILNFNEISQDSPRRNAGEWIHVKKNGEKIVVEVISHQAVLGSREIKIVSVYDVTEKAKAKAGLEKSERIFRSIAESFPNGSVNILDKNFVILYTNGAEYEQLHVDRAAYRGTKFTSYHNGVLRQDVNDLLNQCLKGQIVKFDTEHNGSHYNILATPLKLDDSYDEKILLITQNVSDKKKTEEHLKLLESAVINTPNGVMITDNPPGGANPAILYVNRSVEKISGYAAEELIGKSPLMFKGEDTDETVLYQMFAATAAHRTFEGDLKFYNKAGGTFWLHLSIVPVFDTARVCTHFIGLWVDITDRKKGEQEIKKANERYEILSLATNEAIWDWDIETNKMVWSRATQKVFGYTDIDNRNTGVIWWKRRIHPDDRKRVLKNLGDTLKNKSHIRSEEYLFLCKNGQYKQVFDQSYLIYDQLTGDPVRMIGSLQDITDLRNKELELLEQNRKIYEIAHINSHVIRKPVASILGLLAILDKSKINGDETKMIFDYIEICAKELDEIIKTIAHKSIYKTNGGYMLDDKMIYNNYRNL